MKTFYMCCLALIAAISLSSCASGDNSAPDLSNKQVHATIRDADGTVLYRVELSVVDVSTPTPTDDPAITATPTDEPTATVEPTATDTASPTPTNTATPTSTETPTATATSTATMTPVPTDTPTATATMEPTRPPQQIDVWAFDVNLSFVYTALPADERQQYDRLYTALQNPQQYPKASSAALSGDLYQCGRTLNAHVSSLMSVFRITGDPVLLDYVDARMQELRSTLADTNGDGFLNWRWLNDQSSIYYGNDTHQMDEILCHSLVAYMAVAYDKVKDVSPTYAERAAFWRDYLLNHFVAKWDARAATGKVLQKDLTHAYAGHMRLEYYLWELTGQSRWYNNATTKAAKLLSMTMDNNGRLEWDHRVPGFGNPPYGCQAFDYAGLTILAVADMGFEHFAHFASDTYMAKYAATIRDNVLKYDAVTVGGDVCGDGTGMATVYMVSNDPLIAAWDATGEMVADHEAMYQRHLAYTTNRSVIMPASQFVALWTDGQGVEE